MKIKRKLGVMMILIVVISALVGCSGGNKEENNAVKIALVHTVTGLGDNNMNDIAYAGLEKARDELGIEFTNVEPKEIADYEVLLNELAATEEYDLIISLSVEQKDALEKVSANYPDQKFYTNSYILEGDNISSSEVIWEEFMFMAGYINAKLTTSGLYENLNDDPIIGLVYANDTPQQTIPAAGYVAGAKLANPEVEVQQSVVGDFQDISRAKELAIGQYGEGVDIVQAFAGKAGLGVINAAGESDLYASGVSVNQNTIDPDHVIHTTLNRLDVSIYDQIKTIVDGTWAPGTVYVGIKAGQFEIETEGSNLEIPQEILDEAEEAGQKAADGEIVIPQSMEEMDQFIADYCG